ncbi:MAG: hypothetical protein M3396_07900 [Actinomycetota bacterium]|nr:hypothetical protein [Actinomycetota bacterium]
MAVVAWPLAALVWHARQWARGSSSPSLRALVLAQSAVFLAQEGMEHLLGGDPRSAWAVRASPYDAP